MGEPPIFFVFERAKVDRIDTGDTTGWLGLKYEIIKIGLIRCLSFDGKILLW